MAEELKLSVPEPARGPLEALVAIGPARVRDLATAFSVGARLLTVEEIEGKLVDTVPALAEEAPGLAFALTSLLDQVDLNDEGTEAVASAVIDDLDLPQDEDRGALVEALRDLLLAPDLYQSARAYGMLTAYEHLFLGARIFTDVRPVFPRDDVSRFDAAVVVQVLRIEHYGEDGRRRSFHVSLDDSDLVELKKRVDRAIKKSATIKGFLEASNLSTWGMPDGDSTE